MHLKSSDCDYNVCISNKQSCQIAVNMLYIGFKYILKKFLVISKKLTPHSYWISLQAHVANLHVWPTSFRYCTLRQRKTFQLVKKLQIL